MIPKIFWGIALAAGAIAVLVFLIAAREDNLVRQQTGVIIAIAIAVIPGCIARSIQALDDAEGSDDQTPQEELEMRLRTMNEKNLKNRTAL